MCGRTDEATGAQEPERRGAALRQRRRPQHAVSATTMAATTTMTTKVKATTTATADKAAGGGSTCSMLGGRTPAHHHPSSGSSRRTSRSSRGERCQHDLPSPAVMTWRQSITAIRRWRRYKRQKTRPELGQAVQAPLSESQALEMLFSKTVSLATKRSAVGEECGWTLSHLHERILQVRWPAEAQPAVQPCRPCTRPMVSRLPITNSLTCEVTMLAMHTCAPCPDSCYMA